MTRQALLTMLTASAFLTGCAGIPSDVGSGAATSLASERTGVSLRYTNGLEDPGEVLDRVAELLAQPVTSESAAELALLRNRRVQAAFARADIALSSIIRARTQANPTLSAEWLLPTSGGGDGVLGVGIATRVIDILFMSSRVESAGQNARAATFDAAATVLTIAGNAQRALIDAAALAEVAALASEELEISSAAASAARELHRVGNVPVAMVVEAEAREQEDRLSASSAHSDAEAAKERLCRAIGLTGSQAKALRLSSTYKAPDISSLAVNDVAQVAVDRSLALAAQQGRLMALLAGQPEADVSAWLFGLKVGLEAEYDPQGHTELGPTLGFSLPLFGRDDSAARSLTARVVEASEEYLAMAVDVRSMARETWPQLLSSMARYELARGPGLDTADRALNEAIANHNAMQIGVFEVLEARRGVTQAKRREVLARREAWMSWLDVHALATGAPIDGMGSRSSTLAVPESATTASAGH